ncbi:hypothetical protein [Comamonas sp. JC664]|uniref:hypothetical protein n=1 Tax=Comamonas sp. JC664 TaxID=2801917 RepID=UPI0017497048|nr:hypothetical protein [Comamonas sp. JC664]MBL0692859.1 hypothetical protein [Comamonas sp. JC664]GHG90883.1 hypothetical protein GCM10012319_51250 [Comamonas sp. KCTC 72670]
MVATLAWVGCDTGEPVEIDETLKKESKDDVFRQEAAALASNAPVSWVAPTLVVDSQFPGGTLRFNSEAEFTRFLRAFDAAEASASGSVSGTQGFSAANTNSAQQNFVTFTLSLVAGQDVDLGTCGVEGSAFTGDTYLRVFNSGNVEVASNDDACGGTGSRVTFTASATGTYQVRMGCFSSGSCSGTTSYVINDAIGAGATSTGAISFGAANTSSATQDTSTVSMVLQQGQTLSMGTCGLVGASFTGDTYLRVYNGGNVEVAVNDDACGGRGSRIDFTPGSTGTYQIRMGCFASGACSGTLAYSVTAPLTQAQMLPAGFTSAHAALRAAPFRDPAGDAILDVSEAEFLNDLKLYLTDDDSIRKLVDSELQVVVGNSMRHITNLGVFTVELSQLAAYRSWYNANRYAINIDLNYTSVPGETPLGNGVYQVMPGVTRSVGRDYGVPDLKLLGYDEEGGGIQTLTGEGFEKEQPASEPSVLDGFGNKGTEYGRIAYWWGKVNLHTTASGAWTHDTDCTSGANLDPLAYCRKYWPHTASVQEVPVTQKPGAPWLSAGCRGPTADNGQREFLCKDTLACNTVPPAIDYKSHAIGASFRDSKEVPVTGNKRFVFKAQHTGFPLNIVYTRIGVKAKLQRKKRFLGIGYWGPSNADEMVIAVDNMHLSTDYVFPYPPQFSTLAQPKFDGLADYTIGNWMVKTMNIRVNGGALGFRVTTAQVANWANKLFNTLIGNAYNNIYEGIVTNMINSIDPGFSQRYKDYAKRVLELDDQNRVQWSIGDARKPQCYGESNRWTFNWNIGFGGAEYSYQMKAGAFSARARVGSAWYGLRYVRQ